MLLRALPYPLYSSSWLWELHPCPFCLCKDASFIVFTLKGRASTNVWSFLAETGNRQELEHKALGFRKGQLQVLALVVATVVHGCIPAELYESLEEQQKQSEAEMQKIKKELSVMLCHLLPYYWMRCFLLTCPTWLRLSERQKTKTDNSTAASLANKMRSKYGK
eukprot:TRINITY_DN8917_c0_g1_i4.p1 TRINITY_DN8917_c0_g1~~TRINITY_DN8917_c0_g1_i4.p1  ORF type:complete len:164 (+),score=7.91 TRINITY_DN8917_c0_g1_i4:232-723(+)